MKKKVAIITSGGDGSGINAAINMIAMQEDIDLYGFNGGFDGILYNIPIHISKKYSSQFILEGKQIIKTSRSKKTFDKKGRKEIIKKLIEYKFEYLIVCGGNGSLKGAKLLYDEGFPTIFIPMSVDNDIAASDYTIGYDTALNHIVKVIHDIKDTSYNMPGRIFMIEVLGGNCGQLALASAVAGGVDMAIISEFSTSRKKISDMVKEKLKYKDSLIIICSESSYEEKNYNSGNQGVSFEIGKHIEEEVGIRVRQSVLGYYMRSGIPTYKDVSMAAKLGWIAGRCVKNNNPGNMIIIKNGEAVSKPFSNNIEESYELEHQLVNIAKNNKIIIKE